MILNLLTCFKRARTNIGKRRNECGAKRPGCCTVSTELRYAARESIAALTKASRASLKLEATDRSTATGRK